MSRASAFSDMEMKDFCDFIFSLTEYQARHLLAMIGNEARWLHANGDVAMKLDFVDNVCDQFDPLVRDWVQELIELKQEWGDA